MSAFDGSSNGSGVPDSAGRDESGRVESGDVTDIDNLDDFITPGDGYRVEAYDYRDGSIVLNMYVKGQGERLWNYEIAKWGESTEETRGDRSRLYWLWAAFCHYLNAGGPPSMYLNQMEAMCAVSGWGNRVREDTDLPEALPLKFPPGFYVADTGPMEEFDVTKFEHVLFNRDNDEAIVWCEDVDIEETTQTELKQMIRDSAAFAVELEDEGEDPVVRHPCDSEEDAGPIEER